MLFEVEVTITHFSPIPHLIVFPAPFLTLYNSCTQYVVFPICLPWRQSQSLDDSSGDFFVAGWGKVTQTGRGREKNADEKLGRTLKSVLQLAKIGKKKMSLSEESPLQVRRDGGDVLAGL